jgi:hypothetical protein
MHDYTPLPEARFSPLDAAGAYVEQLANADSTDLGTLTVDQRLRMRYVLNRVPAIAVHHPVVTSDNVQFLDVLRQVAMLGDRLGEAYRARDAEQQRFTQLHNDVQATRRLLGVLS